MATKVFNIEFDNNQLSVHKTLDKHSSKLIMLLDVDGVALEMVVDTGTELLPLWYAAWTWVLYT